MRIFQSIFLISLAARSLLFASDSFLLQKKMLVSGEEREYFVSRKESGDRDDCDVLIFFHGLESERKISRNTWEKFLEMEKQVRGKNVILVFPVGCEGAFPSKLDHLAWEPALFEKNVSFLDHLIEKIKEEYEVGSILIGGFSNGAYFASRLLNERDQNDVKGYWLQGGGHNITKERISGKKVVLEVGVSDPWHFDIVRAVRSSLCQKGWIERKDLLYHELDGGHVLNLSFLDENLNFLHSKQNRRNDTDD